MPLNILYLASQSQRRKDILKLMRIPFRVVLSRYHEKPISRLSAQALVRYHAYQKAKQAVLPKQARFVLGADTVVVYRHHILGKPRHHKEAAELLKLLSGKRHYVLTGLAVWDRVQKIWIRKVEKTPVTFKKLTDKGIEKYLRCVNPLDKAGGYAIQEGPKIVKKIKGSYSNVVGLPRESLKIILRKIGFFKI